MPGYEASSVTWLLKANTFYKPIFSDLISAFNDRYTMYMLNLLWSNIFMPRWADPPRYTVVVVCVSLSVHLSVFPSHVSLQCLKIKALKLVLQVKHAILLKKYWTDFGFKALLSTYGVMMLTSTAVVSNPESSNEPIPHNKLLMPSSQYYAFHVASNRTQFYLMRRDMRLRRIVN